MGTMDGKEIKQDALPGKGQTSAANPNPSEPAPRTYTEEDIAKRHSKLDATIARLTKEKEAVVQQGQSTLSQLSEMQKRIDEIETQRYSEDPDALSRHRAQVQFRKEREDFERERNQHKVEWEERQEEIKAASIIRRDATIIKLAAKHGLDPKVLDKDYLQTEDQITDFAETISPKKEQPSNLVVDPGGTRGGVPDRYTAKQIQSMSPKEITALQAKYNKTLMQLIAEGVIVEK